MPILLTMPTIVEKTNAKIQFISSTDCRIQLDCLSQKLANIFDNHLLLHRKLTYQYKRRQRVIILWQQILHVLEMQLLHRQTGK